MTLKSFSCGHSVCTHMQCSDNICFRVLQHKTTECHACAKVKNTVLRTQEVKMPKMTYLKWLAFIRRKQYRVSAGAQISRVSVQLWEWMSEWKRINKRWDLPKAAIFRLQKLSTSANVYQYACVRAARRLSSIDFARPKLHGIRPVLVFLHCYYPAVLSGQIISHYLADPMSGRAAESTIRNVNIHISFLINFTHPAKWIPCGHGGMTGNYFRMMSFSADY